MTLIPSDLRESIAGDLQEEYVEIRRRHGPLRARLWFWWHSARLAAAFYWERSAHGRGLPPIADEPRRAIGVWDSLRQDLRFGARMLRRQPGFTFVALLTLALGVGSTTAIFSIVDAVLWRPLPYADADRIMSVAEARPREGRWFGPIAPADFFDWQHDARSFSALAAIGTQSPTRPLAYGLTGIGEPEPIRALEVSPSFLTVLGLQPALGRDFRADEATVGRHRVVLLTDGLWRRRFGGDPSIVGRTLSFDGNPYEVLGVLPPRFWWPNQPELLAPLALSDDDRALRAAHFLDAVGRLREGVSIAQAHEDLRIIGVRLAQEFPTENANHAPNFRPLRDALVGDSRAALLVLLAAVALVLLIACANVATLLLARAAGRDKELAIRRAVGASRSRVIQQILTESILLAAAGGVAGVGVAAWALAAFRGLISAPLGGLPGIAVVSIDSRVLAAAIALSAATGVLFGLAPALAGTDRGLNAALGEDTRGTTGGARSHRLRTALMIAELALSLVLLVDAALLIVSFRNLMSVEPGFEPAAIVATPVKLPSSRYADHTRTAAFFDAVLDRLRAAPGIERAAATSWLPLAGADSRLNLVIERRTETLDGQVRAHPRLVSPDYFQTMGIPLVRGRIFRALDRESSGNVAIVNEAAIRYWEGRDPIGERISLGAPDDWRTVVGIVGNTPEGLDSESDPAVYLPQHQRFLNLGNGFERSMTLVVRRGGDRASAAAAVRAAVRGVDSQVPIGSIRAMTDLIDDSVAARRLTFVLVASFATVAVMLTAAGLYGVVAYAVTARRREIGVRIALGATRAQLFGMMLRQAGATTAIGIGAGLIGALVATRAMTSLLFGVGAANPVIYVCVSLLLAAVAALAVAVPATRATRVDPLTALR